jgi:hypothetical protein
MKQLALSIAAFVGLGIVATPAAWARGPAGGMGYGALKGTSNPPRAGSVAAPYGQYTYRPYKPGPTYNPAIRNVRPLLSSPSSTTIPQGSSPNRAVPRTNLASPFSGPYYYYRW